MELKIVEDKKTKVVLEIRGEDHTFVNALTDELWNDDSVKVAAYRIDHPLIGVPTLIVETSGKPASEVLSKAAQRLGKDAEKLVKEASNLK